MTSEFTGVFTIGQTVSRGVLLFRRAFKKIYVLLLLTCLTGVSWPTASVILHFFHPDPYPIMDFRALWSVSLKVPAQYTFEFWWEYVKFCRGIASRSRVDMRTLDRALWQYSKERQK